MEDKKIELADYISHLRQQLTKAANEGETKSVRFEVKNLELELETVAEKTREGKGGVKFWIVSVGGSAATEDQVTQRLKLTLRPEDAVTEDGGNMKLSREEVEGSSKLSR